MSAEVVFEHISVAVFVLWIVYSGTARLYPYAYGPAWVPAIVALLVALAVTIPVGGLSIAGALLTVNPVFSLGLTALAAAGCGAKILDAEILNGRDTLIFASWNAALGAALYLSATGVLPMDLYYLGYGFSPLFWALGLLTFLLVLTDSALKWIFILYIGSWCLGVLPSPNLFDYIIDPFLFFISIGVLAVKVAGSLGSSRRSPASAL